LARVKAPVFVDDEETFDDLQQRIQKTIAFVESVPRQALDGSEDRLIEMRFRSVNGLMKGDLYLLTVLIPNFFFHVATVHDILRHVGMPIGKKDYFGELPYVVV
jgi:hypothetical protein